MSVGSKWPPSPLQPVDTLLVVRISDCIEEVAISPRPADILWRAASNRFDQTRVGDSGRRIGNPLDADGVFPAVAEVVEICERPDADILQHVDEPGLAGVEGPSPKVGSGLPQPISRARIS